MAVWEARARREALQELFELRVLTAEELRAELGAEPEPDQLPYPDDE